jgi:hypothetical protein
MSEETKATGGKERRRFPRACFHRLVSVEGDGKLFTANLEELSEGGLRLEAAWLDPEIKNVTVRVPLRGRYGLVDHCQLRGKVVRRRGQMVGIKFRRMLPRHKLQLRDYVWRSRPHY